MNPYREIFEQLNAKGIRYLVVGGVAVNLHGYSRFTGDIDIILALDHANLDVMGKLMEEMKFTQRLPIDVRELSDAKRVQKFLDEKGMTAYTFIDPKQSQFSIDILASASLDFEQFNARKVLIDIGKLSIPVIAIDDLIGMKKQANNVDLDYLRRCKASTPAQRLDWLAAAREFALMPKKKVEKKKDF